MNIRLQKYKKNRLVGMNQYNAARAAGYSEGYSRKACKIEMSAKISMADAFEQAGFTDKKIIEVALEGMGATKLYGKAGLEHADWSARHRFFETVLRLMNKIQDVPLIDQSKHTHLHFLQEAIAKANLINAYGRIESRETL
ncbi:MAG: hypothetical protein KJ718_00830 [Nanoarchaeota archaeon]|nr:hypothetical protein [Nanoarchaeota archaeon]